MRALGASIAKVGPSEVAVLIAGESGTGKELVADAVHRASARRDGPLVKVNCAALVETLLLSELFGHEKGAFTGASNRHAGRFEEARGGTLFLDEIGDISPRTQVALLRVLQDGTYYRVGGTTPLRADVRVVCATHRDLRAMVERGEFRQDLYYRLCGVTLEVPALRDRLGDLPLLCTESLLRIAAERGGSPRRVSEAALVALRRHGWPGNVRELDNALRSASLFAEGDAIELSDLVTNVESLRYLADDIVLAGLDDTRPPSTRPPSSPTSSLDAVYQTVVDGTSLPEMRRQLELGCILRALTESDGNVTQAAKKLGMKRPRPSQLIHQHGLKTKGGAS
jgi:DNA-binding NtrC family response regulator